MITKIQGEAPFQVLTNNFSISPSQEGYTLQISADGVNYSNLFSVGANVTRLVTGVAANSYYRLLGNASEVSINWMKTCVTEGGGGSGSTYTAGEYISIEQDVISVTGITPDEYLTTADTQNFVTSGDVATQISAATQGFATEAYVTGATSPIQTQLDDIERVTATALTELHQGILDLSGATQAFVTSGDVATQITAATANLMTSSATQTMINTATSGITEELSDLEDMMETKEEVIAAALVDLDGRIPDMSDYYTSAQTQNAITAATQGFVTSGDVATQISTATANMVESTTVSTIWTGTQAQYDLIANPDPNTLYIIKNN